MKIQNNISIIIAAFVCLFFSACSNEEDYFADNTQHGSSQMIYSDIVLEAENGEKETNITRGIGDQGFTNDYTYDYIYVHSTTDESKTLKVPLKEVEYCGDCRGIHLEMIVTDNGTGYTLRTEDGVDELTLGENEEVYFSSYPSTTWEASPLENVSTPVLHSDVFTKNDDVNMELLRSEQIYGKDALIELLQTPTPQIKVKRHCTGFAVNFMFTNVDAMGGPDQPMYGVTAGNWNTYLPGTTPDDFYIKLYIGPNFCHRYNIYNNSVPEEDEGGFYVIQNNQYAPFESVLFTNSGLVTDDPVSYNGFGYRTKADDILIAPLNTSLDLTQFSIYAFVKYMPEGGDVNSDAGSVWIRIPIEDMTFTLNRIHNYVICLDINELKEVMELSGAANTLTRGLWSEPRELKLKYPVKVLNIQE